MLAHPALAQEQEYFTWVDEQGRVHNSPKAQPASPASSPASAPATTDAPQGFLSEEEFEKQQAKDNAERPAFFTWIDGQGRLESQPIAAPKEVDTQALGNEQITNHQLLPSERLTNLPEPAACCAQYRAQFKPLLAFKAQSIRNPQLSTPLRTEQGGVPAWYWSVANFHLGEQKLPELTLRLWHSQAPMGLLALDENYLPLYYLERLQVKNHPQTWRSLALQESVIAVADAQVRYFIVFFPEGAKDNAQIELEWKPN